MSEPESTPPSRPPVRASGGTRWLLGLTIVGIGVVVASGAALFWALGDDVPEIADEGWLRVPLGGALADAPKPEGLFFEPEDIPPTVTEIAGAIRHAATDERVNGVLVELDGASGGIASWNVLRDALVDLKAAGKPCVVYQASAFTNNDYWMATACETVVMAPAAVMLVNGMSIEMEYYKGTFDWLGVTPEFEHVGDFKSFIETYERTGPSEQAAQAYEGLIDSLWSRVVGGIAEGRGVSVEVVNGWIDQPTLAPKAAMERGMIDALGWPDAVRANLASVAEEGWAAKLDAPVTAKAEDAEKDLIKLKDYLPTVRAAEKEGDGQVAVIFAEGQIVSGGTDPGLFGDDGLLTDGEFAGWMKDAREDDDVKAVVLRVNSPGGSALAASAMLREVERTRAAGKPVVISMGDLAASGGYLISCTADRVFAEPTTITGSIGVFGGKFALGGAFAKLGITTHAFQRGAQAGLLSPVAPFTDSERATFRAWLEDFYQVFVQQVADGRKKTFEEIHAVAQGRVWTGDQALANGLVDELGGVDDAIAHAAELASLEDPAIRRIPAAKGFFDLLMEDLQDSAKVELPFDLSQSVRGELSVLEEAGRTGGAILMLPGGLRVK
jgi:protease-4